MPNTATTAYANSRRATQLAVTRERLKLYLAAEKAILSGQSYKIEGLELTRANLDDVQNMITKLTQAVSELAAGVHRARYKVIIPREGW